MTLFRNQSHKLARLFARRGEFCFRAASVLVFVAVTLSFALAPFASSAAQICKTNENPASESSGSNNAEVCKSCHAGASCCAMKRESPQHSQPLATTTTARGNSGSDLSASVVPVSAIALVFTAFPQRQVSFDSREAARPHAVSPLARNCIRLI